MSKAVLYNENSIAIMVIGNVLNYEKTALENDLMDYKIESETLGIVDLKGSAFSIAFFDDSVEIEENQDISEYMTQIIDEKSFIKVDELTLRDQKIQALTEHIDTLENAIIELMEMVL